jgi:hypothetical protein
LKEKEGEGFAKAKLSSFEMHKKEKEQKGESLENDKEDSL